MFKVMFPQVPQSSRPESSGFPRNTPSPWTPRDPKKNPTGYQLQVHFFFVSRDPLHLPIWRPYTVGVSKNRGGPPKWMAYNGKTLLNMG